MKVFENCEYKYIYTVDFENDYVKEYKVPDNYVDGSLGSISSYYIEFPYKACGFEDPYSLLSSPDWKVEDFEGNIIINGGEDF